MKVCLASLTSETGVRFSIDADESRVPCFAILHRGAVYAYENRCPHLGTQLDWSPGLFMDDEEEFIICATHGALFEPATGRCIVGPCQGQSLTALEISVDDANSTLTTSGPAPNHYV